MKKSLAAILALLYLSTSMGATLHFHYCMGKLASWGLINHESKSCALCGAPKKVVANHCIAPKNDCCQDDYKQIKVGGDQKVSQLEFQVLKLLPAALVVNYQPASDISFSSFLLEHSVSNSPPRTQKIPVFILHCDFRI
jgi:hypothetical protein